MRTGDMCETWDMALMWLVYLVEVACTVALGVVAANVLQEDRSAVAPTHDVWWANLAFALVNVLSGVLLACYFGSIAKQLQEMTKWVDVPPKDPTRPPCEGLRLDTKNAGPAMWTSLVALIGGLGSVGVFFVLGFTQATQTCPTTSVAYEKRLAEARTLQIVIVVCKLAAFVSTDHRVLSWVATANDARKGNETV